MLQNDASANELHINAELESIKSRFRAEIEQMQDERNSLSSQVSELQNTHDALQAEIDKLKAEKSQLIKTNENLSRQKTIIQRAASSATSSVPLNDTLSSSRPPTSKSLDEFSVEELPTHSPHDEKVYPDIDALVESISTEALAAMPEDIRAAATGVANSALSTSVDNLSGSASNLSINTTKRHHTSHKALPQVPITSSFSFIPDSQSKKDSIKSSILILGLPYFLWFR